ncbi:MULTISPECIES: hypothetical protein [unclassified Rhodococcus (in: high G+C Gram-positive bacteria)]|jgi:hypothetical protein|uniref:hypothetical protein n=1 Tax=unclassified Rhodococcus (in: high G+C Gram-positive bacteria) TaxID=192944 RepID=UPI000A9F680F|nr:MULTISPECIES: hypothetical protein [unclassified Rhodococcus (in: high G+C Gram-positive bacteria)]MDQ1178706.1 putative alkaline shock family protein YloU [Rhodococcus sp. SORGH_AS_0301]MDQ1199986.1 putative alkaline shock family protein YloU [Rhodococcus sp. SORGH_AS_0303]
MSPAAPSGSDRADLVADAVVAVDGVASLHGGMFGEIGTYLPGRRVAGVAIRDDGTEIHIAVTPDAVVRETADAVRRAVRAVVDAPVHVVVEDVASPSDGGADTGSSGPEPTESSEPGSTSAPGGTLRP